MINTQISFERIIFRIFKISPSLKYATKEMKQNSFRLIILIHYGIQLNLSNTCVGMKPG